MLKLLFFSLGMFVGIFGTIVLTIDFQEQLKGYPKEFKNLSNGHYELCDQMPGSIFVDHIQVDGSRTMLWVYGQPDTLPKRFIKYEDKVTQ